jgi:hypothetical protein
MANRVNPEKYRMFTNYMFNELGITREDIRGWVREVVFEVAESYIRDQFHGDRLDRKVKEVITDQLRSEKQRLYGTGYDITMYIKEAISAVVKEQLDIKITPKE